jgi:hypothetical protein
MGWADTDYRVDPQKFSAHRGCEIPDAQMQRTLNLFHPANALSALRQRVGPKREEKPLLDAMLLVVPR